MSRGSSLPPWSPKVRRGLDARKYEEMARTLLFPIKESRRQRSNSPPQALIRDVKSLLQRAKRTRVKVTETVETLLSTLRRPSKSSLKPPLAGLAFHDTSRRRRP